jgi:hypothetical protein
MNYITGGEGTNSGSQNLELRISKIKFNREMAVISLKDNIPVFPFGKVHLNYRVSYSSLEIFLCERSKVEGISMAGRIECSVIKT